MESLEVQQQEILAKSMRKKGITPRKMKKILKQFNKQNQDSATKVLEISIQLEELIIKNKELEDQIKELKKGKTKDTKKKSVTKKEIIPSLQEKLA
jgi:ribosomal protein L22